MIPSISTDILQEYEPDEAIRVIGEAGFRCVEFGFGHEADFLEGKEDEGARIERIKRAAEKAGVQILQMHGRLFNPLSGKDSEANIAWAHRSIERAAKLGVKWVVLHPGGPAGPGADPKEYEETTRFNLDLFTSYAKTAARVGTGVAVENMIGGARGLRWGAGVTDLVRLVDAIDGPIGICWDTGHAELSRVPQGRAIRAIGHRLKALHINDNDGLEDRHWAPYRGQANWEEVVAALREIVYAGPFNAELPGEQKATPTPVKPAKLAYLRQLLGLMTQAQVSAQAAS